MLDFDSVFQNDSTFNKFIYWDNLDHLNKTPPSLRINFFLDQYKNEIILNNKIDSNDLYVCRTLPDKQSVSLTFTMKDINSIKRGRWELCNLSTNIEKKIVVRLRPGDTFNRKENRGDDFALTDNLIFAEENLPIHQLYSSSRIIIFEGLSTGIGECLGLNKPFLLFLNESYLELRQSRLCGFVKDLEDLGMVCSSAEELCKNLTEDYLTRYYSDSFQSKLEVIRSLYVPTSKNYLKEWIHFFGEMNA